MRKIGRFKIDLKNITADKWLLIALAGVLLVMCSIPSSKKNEEESGKNNVSAESNDCIQEMDNKEYTEYMEKRLEKMIENIDGVGEAEVMITLKSTGEKVVLMEQPYSKSEVTESDDSGGSRKTNEISEEQNVIYKTDSQGETIPYVVKENEPEIEGIAIAAQGGSDERKAVQIISVTEALFSVSAHKISVVEMNK